jgi:hypothetical protein
MPDALATSTEERAFQEDRGFARGSGELLSRSGTPRLLDDPAAISCGMTVTVAEARGRQSSR